jgi:hypothetical protein
MKVYTNFGELAQAPDDIYQYFLEMEGSNQPLPNTMLMTWYGGNVHVIETLEDLKEIKTSIESEVNENDWASIVETPAAFDACRQITKNFVEVYMTWNNDGGPSYFIPTEIAAQCPNVAESIKMSKTDFDHADY